MWNKEKVLWLISVLFCYQTVFCAVPQSCDRYENKDPCSFPGEVFRGICTAPEVCVEAYQEAQKQFVLQASADWSFQLIFRNNTYLPVTISIEDSICIKPQFSKKRQTALIIYSQEDGLLKLISDFNSGNCRTLPYAYADISVISNTDELPSGEDFSAKLLDRYAMGKDYRILMQSIKDEFSGKRLWTIRKIIEYSENGSERVIQDCSSDDNTSCKTIISLDYDWQDND